MVASLNPYPLFVVESAQVITHHRWFLLGVGWFNKGNINVAYGLLHDFEGKETRERYEIVQMSISAIFVEPKQRASAVTDDLLKKFGNII